MSPKKESQSEESNLTSPRISKGLALLQSMASRGSQNTEMKRPRNQNGLSKSAQAISNYYRKTWTGSLQPTESRTPASASRRLSHFCFCQSQSKRLACPDGFACKIEELRKAFLVRPGCPQFSTRATSMSHMGSATTVDLPRDTCVSPGSWKLTEDQLLDRRGSAVSVDGHLIPFSKSACELNYPHQESEPPSVSPSTSSSVRRSQKTRMPWYISVIHEKDQSLLMLEGELQRLSELEAQVQKKDQEILALQKEREALQEALRSLLKSKGPDTAGPAIRMMQEGYGRMEPSRERQTQLDGFLEEKSSEGLPEETLITTVRGRMGGKGTGQEGNEEGQEGAEEAEEEVVEEEEEEDQYPKRAYWLTESFEEELIAQMEEYEHMLVEFQTELDLTRAKYSLATGAIMSLQRQVDLQESQLQKVNTENELLEKELRERKRQIQAMTDKFSSLREEKKQQEIMGLIEKENLGLRQQVSDLERDLTRRDETITDLHTKVTELRAQVNLSENHLQRWKQLHNDLQGRNETIQQMEQQTRVILENSQARLEKLRNKIIQAAFTVVSGAKNLATEISDNCILDVLQRIISERSDFYNQLKQKGVKVPPLQQSDISLPTKAKKVSPK
ncbi:coiled-coil domain-containing protein 27 [Nannospalax galili]|uniref:coiled-coil domain-containing protein 27 n=1 Tax=Nannospalax galili TaxID=1026970 RepID=UPI00111C2704|nr:coiled-coil domain-containing protein 27 [Nannospalax galili]